MPTLSPSLRVLFGEIDARWPHRDRRTDGWYRDPRVGVSVGHNPGARGLVHAIDVDRDGLDPMYIVNHITKVDGLLWYIIWNRTLYSDTYNWVPRAYTGSNPHTDHLHIEIRQTVAAETYLGYWGISLPPAQQGIGPAPGSESGEASWDYTPTVHGTADQFLAGGNALANMATSFRQLRRL